MANAGHLPWLRTTRGIIVAVSSIDISTAPTLMHSKFFPVDALSFLQTFLVHFLDQNIHVVAHTLQVLS
jgi:hypothetical protein